MEKFTTLTGVAAPLRTINVDTDMIIPKQYLKTIKRTGLGTGPVRRDALSREDGNENPDFVLNKPAYRKAKILVAGDNFGCGSSREHAPWALLDFGIRCVISTSFADIFYNNCFKNGILPIMVSPGGPGEADGRRRARRQRHADGRSRGPGRSMGRMAARVNFDIDAFRKHCLLNGLDDIGLTMEKAPRSTPTSRSSPSGHGPDRAAPPVGEGPACPPRRLASAGGAFRLSVTPRPDETVSVRSKTGLPASRHLPSTLTR